jgi:outer membrane protein assembly factor BamB
MRGEMGNPGSNRGKKVRRSEEKTRKKHAFRQWIISLTAVMVLGAVLLAAESYAQNAEKDLARHILKETGVKGGVIVHLGSGDGKLTAALRVNERYLVHGLDADKQNVEKARKNLQSRGVYGPVSIGWFDGARLPYAENMVNLIVAENPGDVSKEEMLRALAPNGVAYVKAGGKWNKMVKPWPSNIDEWTHWLHGPDGNAVARDSVVGPPRHLQWAAAPRWQRHHNTAPSTTGMVSSKGRLFYISDEAPPGFDPEMPDNWFLVARDAFNGALLWKRPIANWGWNQWNDRWEGRFNTPPHLPKRIVAAGDRLFATMNFNAPLSELDGATGKTLRVYEGTENTDEILYKDGLLILSLNEEARTPQRGETKPVKKSVCVIDAASGKQLWKKGSYSGLRAKSDASEVFGRLELVAGDDNICLADRDALICLDLKTGYEKWRTPRPAFEDKTIDAYFIRYTDQCTMVYQDGVLLFAQPEFNARVWHSFPGKLYAYDAKNGEPLWHKAYGGWSHNWQPDVFVVDGVVWIHDHTVVDQPDWKTGHREDKTGIDYYLLGLDLKTGAQKRKFSTNETMHVDHHHRCYRGKATERFLLASRRGVEFLDLETEENTLNHWTRGACLHGIMPSNGLLYLTPHPCRCYIEAQLNGYYGLAPRASRAPETTYEQQGRDRLEKGPAFESVRNPKSEIRNRDDWPMFRSDSRRSGSAAAISGELAPAWKIKAGGRLSPPTVAGGKVFVSSIDEHKVSAYNAADGKELWSYTAGGRVDTPPTIYQGLVLFGSADGAVYCLTAADGQLAWRFQAAPGDRLVGAYGQIESAWPVHGSILVEDGKAYVAAGRSSYLDDGFALYVLNPTTGEVIEQRRFYSADPETDKMSKPTYNRKVIPGTLDDVLVSDGSGAVFMRQEHVFGKEPTEKKYLFSTSGLLDEDWFDRTYWGFGKTAEGSSARMMVFDDALVYAVTELSNKKNPVGKPGAAKYQIFADVVEPTPLGKFSYEDRNKIKKMKPARQWTAPIPLRVTAMAVAGPTLVAAGTPSVAGHEDPLGARAGRRGAGFWLLSTKDGSKLAEYDLGVSPVFDGMAVAGGRVYIAASSGELICLSSKN